MVKLKIQLNKKSRDEALQALNKMEIYFKLLPRLAPHIQILLKDWMGARWDRLTGSIPMGRLDKDWQKRKGNKPVGVSSGALRAAVVGTGAGNVNKVSPVPNGFTVTYGVDEMNGVFRNRYPIYFRKWLLEQTKQELIALEVKEANNLAKFFFDVVTMDIYSILGVGKIQLRV